MREGQERQRLMKRDEGENEHLLTEMMLMMPHSASQQHIKTESRQQKKRKRGEDFTSKQFNWRCGMLK